MNNKPLVTILLPVYNVEGFLPQCIESLIYQTYTHLQIVLIDDGSKDRSWQIMQEYAEKDSRIEIYHQENQGVAVTRNHLLEKVKGDYVLFVDSDDWVELDMVEFLVTKNLEHDADVAICSHVINDSPVSSFNDEQLLDQETAIKQFLIHKDLKGSLYTKLVKNSLLHNLTFNPCISYGEDALFCWHFFQKAQKIVVTDRKLYHYRMNTSSISHQSFGDKKLTGHLTWSIITEETSKLWPQYLDIAKARWGMEDMYLLRQAAQSNYPCDNSIKELQQTVKRFLPQMKKTELLKGKEVLNANIMCRWYWYGFLYNKLHQILKQ